jgi:hypothetical protein
MSILLKAVYRLDAILNKLEKENKVGETILPDFKICCKTIIIKSFTFNRIFLELEQIC